MTPDPLFALRDTDACTRIVTDIFATFADLHPSAAGVWQPDADGIAIAVLASARPNPSLLDYRVVVHLAATLAQHLAQSLTILSGDAVGNNATPADTDAREAAKELGNLIAGNLLPQLAPADVELRLEPPSLLHCAACAAAAGAPLTFLTYPQGGLAVWIERNCL